MNHEPPPYPASSLEWLENDASTIPADPSDAIEEHDPIAEARKIIADELMAESRRIEKMGNLRVARAFVSAALFVLGGGK